MFSWNFEFSKIEWAGKRIAGAGTAAVGVCSIEVAISEETLKSIMPEIIKAEINEVFGFECKYHMLAFDMRSKNLYPLYDMAKLTLGITSEEGTVVKDGFILGWSYRSYTHTAKLIRKVWQTPRNFPTTNI